MHSVFDIRSKKIQNKVITLKYHFISVLYYLIHFQAILTITRTNFSKKYSTYPCVVVMGTTGIKDTHTASLYELAFTATRSVSGLHCKVKQRRAQLVAGWVTQTLEQGR